MFRWYFCSGSNVCPSLTRTINSQDRFAGCACWRSLEKYIAFPNGLCSHFQRLSAVCGWLLGNTMFSGLPLLCEYKFHNTDTQIQIPRQKTRCSGMCIRIFPGTMKFVNAPSPQWEDYFACSCLGEETASAYGAILLLWRYSNGKLTKKTNQYITNSGL